MASVYRPKTRRKYYIAYRDAEGRRRTAPGFVDRRATEAKATDIERREARIAVGLETRGSGTTRGVKPSDYATMLRDAGCCEAWAETCERRIVRWEERGVAALEGLASDTRRRYKQLILAWCKFAGRAIPTLPTYSSRESGFVRRALRPVELDALLRGAPPPRSRVYVIAAYTGLRRGEMRRLVWPDVLPDRITIYGKAGRVESVPIHERVASALGPRGEGSVFASIPTHETVRDDYVKAGVVFDGRAVDFHSLRYTFCTMLARAGVSIWDVMKLMRHRDVKLTTRLYLDATQLDTEAAVKRLP